MNHFNDRNAENYDGANGGSRRLPDNLNPTDRFINSFSEGKKNTKRNIESLSRTNGVISVSIKVITFSMGVAYGKTL